MTPRQAQTAGTPTHRNHGGGNMRPGFPAPSAPNGIRPAAWLCRAAPQAGGVPAFYTQNSADMPNRWRLHFAGRHLLLAALLISAAAIMAGKLRYLVNIEK